MMADLFQDQEDIVLTVLSKIKEFMECDDLTQFKPLRMIINGSGGSGKSVAINTIVTVLRKMFGTNDVVKVAAPTGAAAFNVGGETCHHLTMDGVSRSEYKPNSMAKKKRDLLIKKFKNLLCLIIDERSLLDLSLLGTVGRKISETIYEGGHNRDVSFGGLPVLLLVGDDFQLPGRGKGPFDALTLTGGGPMTRLGKEIILECSKMMMNLNGSKRIQADKIADKGIYSF